MAKQRPAYNVDKLMELSVYVDEQQGFIKSGYGYYDRENDVHVHDNKTALTQFMMGENVPVVSDAVKQKAKTIFNYFQDTLIAKKLMGTLNDFEQNVMKTVASETTDGFGLSVIASLPNSYRVAQKRESLDDWFDNLRGKSEFVGRIGERLKMTATIRDVKYIAKFGIHLVTCINTEENIIKFFFNKEPDIAGILEGKTVKITGKVKTHDISKFSQCNETVLHYVKIEEI